MITNERQYKITNNLINKIEEAINSFNKKKLNEENQSKVLIKAELDALLSERENLANQILEYRTLKSGTIDSFRALNLEELPKILIEARISKNLSQRKLAELIGVKEQQIQRYEAELYITANLTRLAQVANALDLNINEIAEFKSEKDLISTKNENIEWDKFPIKEMYKRNWFNDFFNGSLPNAIKNSEQLTKYFFDNTYCKPLFSAAHLRIRSGGIVNKYALIAWQCRILDLARKEKIRKGFSKNALNINCFNNLIKLSIENDGPRKAIDYLYEFGIRLIVQPHLPQTHIDGAVFLINDEAVIGMTLRHDRIDNFWFVLFHELIHLKNHLNKGTIESIFDDLEADADDLEKNTDEEAEEMLIPKNIWETALPRYVQTKEVIDEFAYKLNVNPAIVAGKIRREMKNYAILTNMVGQGEVRKQFPSIDFSY
jgi:HTH-type transcriptional regulator/antitoxin HigA